MISTSLLNSVLTESHHSTQKEFAPMISSALLESIFSWKKSKPAPVRDYAASVKRHADLSNKYLEQASKHPVDSDEHHKWMAVHHRAAQIHHEDSVYAKPGDEAAAAHHKAEADHHWKRFEHHNKSVPMTTPANRDFRLAETNHWVQLQNS